MFKLFPTNFDPKGENQEYLEKYKNVQIPSR